MDVDWQKGIHLYSEEHKDTLYREVTALINSGPCRPEDFNHLDTLHPGGYLGLSEFISSYGINADALVLDAGTGIGGTARFLTARTGCQVEGVDFLQHFVDLGRLITSATGQSEKISFRQGDLRLLSEENKFDLVVTIAVMQLLPGTQVLSNFYRSLKPGGLGYFEEYVLLKEAMTPEEQQQVDDFLIVGTRPVGVLTSQLEAIGFELLECTDVSPRWSQFAWNRSEAVLANPAEVSALNFDIYARQAPALLCHMQELGPEELKAKYPLTFAQVDALHTVYQKDLIVGSRRVVVRKPAE